MIKLISFSIFLISLLGCNSVSNEDLIVDKLPLKTIEAQTKIISVLTGNETIDNTSYSINSRTTIEERQMARAYISQIIKQLNLTPIEHKYQEPNTNAFIDLLIGPFRGTNLFTKVSSKTSSNEYIVLGAHYDTARNCPGANDNASAIAILYGVLKKLSNLQSRNKNVIIVFFDQEEEDLVGSRAFAKYLIKNNLNVHSVHTFDQIGWDKDADKAIELELPTPEIETLYKTQADKLNTPIYITKVNSTDHQSFREVGFNAVGITEEFVNGDTTPFKDTENDTFETIDMEYIASTTQLIFEVMQQLVNEN
ncbi:M28 family peptidase [uncultured Aquimarina sp.]|uniref:M28 family metallopeptidase n=1 Tax=uncultured Aquimarina sp. TaxID=575652 RepID=UPI00261993F2|nr:M28 family peptidase [uncultured Aquimarina sp.]